MSSPKLSFFCWRAATCPCTHEHVHVLVMLPKCVASCVQCVARRNLQMCLLPIASSSCFCGCYRHCCCVCWDCFLQLTLFLHFNTFCNNWEQILLQIGSWSRKGFLLNFNFKTVNSYQWINNGNVQVLRYQFCSLLRPLLSQDVISLWNSFKPWGTLENLE